jgi:hypothetical protein
MKWVLAAALPASYYAARYKLNTKENRKALVTRYRTFSRPQQPPPQFSSPASATSSPVTAHLPEQVQQQIKQQK